MKIDNLDRRQVLASTAALFGASLIAPLARAVAGGNAPDGFKASKSLLDSQQRKNLEVLAERIIPTTDTPGAIEAGVADYIEMMLADWHTKEERLQFLDGLNAIDADARSRFGRAIDTLSPQDQDALLQNALDAEANAEEPGFFTALKQMTVTGYYTSEIGMTVERVYLPVPGRYDGAYPYEKVGTLFTA